MINSAERAPFCEEMEKGFLTTVPAAGRSGQSDAAKLRTEHPQNMITSNHSERERIGCSSLFPRSATPLSQTTKSRVVWQRPTVTGVQSTSQICCQQPMEQLFARFPTCRKPP